MFLDAFTDEMNAAVILYTAAAGTDGNGLPIAKTKVSQWEGLGFIDQVNATTTILGEKVRTESTHYLVIRYDDIAPTDIKDSWLASVDAILYDIVKANDVGNQHEVTVIGLKLK